MHPLECDVDMLFATRVEGNTGSLFVRVAFLGFVRNVWLDLNPGTVCREFKGVTCSWTLS